MTLSVFYQANKTFEMKTMAWWHKQITVCYWDTRKKVSLNNEINRKKWKEVDVFEVLL